ncbi:response regulator [Desulfobacterales bacterium HSG17]|nr:response regulator [Desulfobacterales bacterium HSG17]
MRNKIILLVDDEESILNSFCKDFEYEGYTVGTASSGEQAVTKLQNSHFDLVITDLVMPGVDGIGVLKEATKNVPDICVIILTGYGDLTSAVKALRLGADDYLLKPCDTDELLLRVSRCLEKQDALRKIKVYENILPICMYCKSIRDDTGTEHGKGEWMQVDKYLYRKCAANLSHGYCPECFEKHKDD